MLQIVPSIAKLKESATLAINLQAKELRKKGKLKAHLGFGEAPFPVHPKIDEALKHSAFQNSYLPTQGLPELREAIAEYYDHMFNHDFKSENIFVGPGSKELIFQVLYALQGEVFLPGPSWVSYPPQLEVKGDKPTIIKTDVENNYHLTPEALDRAFSNSDRTQKILIFNNPSNPTGAVYGKDELKAMAEVCRKHQAIILADEIYSQVVFDKGEFHSLAHFYPEKTIVTGGLSKSHSLGGYRLGFLCLPREVDELRVALKSLISETYSCVSSPIQYAAIKAYDLNEKELLNDLQMMTNIHAMAGRYLWRRLKAIGVMCPQPQGAFYLFPELSPMTEKLKKWGINTDRDLALTLLEDYQVATLPGSDFSYPEELYGLRLASVDYNGTEILNAYRDKNPRLSDDEFIEQHAPRLKEGMDAFSSFVNSL